MMKLLAIYMCFLGVVICLVMLYQGWRRTRDVLCLRNFALLGFIVFQLTSAAFPLWMGWNNRYRVQDWESVGLTYAAFATVFLIVFFLAYEWGVGAKTLARLVPTTRVIPNIPTMIIIAIGLTAAAAFLRLVIAVAPIPVVTAVAAKVGVAFGALACGLAGWIWAPRLMNVAYAGFAGGIAMVNLAAVMHGAFGRRNLVALGACFLWGLYYSYFRYLPLRAMVARLVVLGLPPLILLAAFTSIRSSQERPDLKQQVQTLTSQSDVTYGLLVMFQGQNTAPGSMWLIENYPTRYEYRHLMTIRYFFSLPVPRMIWRDKPMPLSTMIATQARITGVNWDILKIGPGILGHAGAEGGWYALIVYALAGAFFLRFFDQVVQINPMSPFVVLPIGSALGQIVGLPRGETSAFAFNYVVGVVGAYFTMIVLARIVRMLGWGQDAPALPAPSAEAAAAYEAGVYEHDEQEGAPGRGHAGAHA